MIMDYAPVKLQTLAVCDDGDVCQGIDGIQKSKVKVHSPSYPKKNMVRPPGFEPGLRAWKARIITRLDYGRSHRKSIVSGYDLRVMIEWTERDRSVEGFDPIERRSQYISEKHRLIEYKTNQARLWPLRRLSI